MLARDIVDVISEIACSDNDRLKQIGQHLIFSYIVEPLSDSFDPVNAALYNRIFSQIIQHARNVPASSELDRTLRRFGIHSEQDLLNRAQRLATLRVFPPAAVPGIKKVLVLSRVTLGADVAITSIILQHVKRVFPNAVITLVAPPRVRELFQGDPQIKIIELRYERSSSLLDRFQTWLELVRVIDEETAGLHPDEFLVIDPDSRLTQLGLLPVTTSDSSYYFFESRTYGGQGAESLGELTARWCNEVFGPCGGEIFPYVSLGPQNLQQAKPHRVVTVSFGYGGNENKRAGESFETSLLLRLLDSGNAVILDKGIGEEKENANRILSRLGRDVTSWDGSAGGFAALISGSDLYIGYDSAFQHIAAALGVPVIDMFIGPPNPIFTNRWRPYSKAIVKVAGGFDPSNPKEYLETVLSLCQGIGFYSESGG